MKRISLFVVALLVVSVLSALISTGEAQSTPFSDEFSSSTMDPRWEVIDPYGGSIFDLTINPGYLFISTSSPPDKDLYGAVNFYAPRILQPASGDITIETKVSTITNDNIQSAGIVLWKDESNFLRLERAQRYDFQEILFIGTINGVWSMPSPEVSNPGVVLHIPNINPTYLRMIRTGNVYSGYYSEDGVLWNFAANITMTIDDPIKIGLNIVNRGPPYFTSTSFMAGFDYFRIAMPSLVPIVDIAPDTLNLKSKGKWITAYIELPEGYDVNDINVSSILLNDTIPAELEPIAIGDCDNDTVPDLMVKFNRTAVSEFILGQNIAYGNVTLTITGEVAGTLFEGSDIIMVRMPGDVNCDGKVDIFDIVLVAVRYGESNPEPYYDMNEDGKIDILDIRSVAIYYGKTYT